MAQPEHDMQVALFQWAAFRDNLYPELKLLFAIPNGGKRDARTGARLKKEGVKAGVPDLCLPVSKRNYNSLFIELKAGKNKPSDKQLWWKKELMAAGNLCGTCYSWEEARDLIVKYLDNDISVR